MKFDEAKWKAAYQKASQDCPAHGPSDGIVCVLATLRFIRDGMLDDIGMLNPAPDADEQDKGNAETIRDSLTELFKSVKEAKTTGGFASNASAAMKFAGLAKANPVETAIEM